MRKPVMENNSHCDIRLCRVRVLPNMSQFTTHYNNFSKRREKFSVRSFSVSTECFSHHQGESEELWTKWMRIFIHALLRWYSAKIFSELKLVTDNLPLHSHRSHWEATEISRIQDMKQGMIKTFENFVTKFGDVASFGGTSEQSVKVESYFPPSWKFSVNRTSSWLQEWPAALTYKAVCCLTRLVIEGLHNCLKKMANAFEIVETVKKELALTEVTVTQFAAGVAPHHHNSHSERPQN